MTLNCLVNIREKTVVVFLYELSADESHLRKVIFGFILSCGFIQATHSLKIILC